MDTPHLAFVSVGSNLGDKLAFCRRGIDALAESRAVRLTACSSFYRTEPVDFRDQDWFVNAVVRIETSLDPFALFELLKTIERQAGRIAPAVRFGPRILDLDLLLYDQLVLDDPRLTLPHPRLHRRRFVLRPLCDINPQLMHPLFGKSVASLLAGLDESGQQVVEY